MAQSANQELVANLKPFIARIVQGMDLSTGGGGGSGTGNLLSSGVIPMDTGYAPASGQQIATKKYIDDGIASISAHPPVTVGNGLAGDLARQYIEVRLNTSLGMEFVGGSLAVRLNGDSGLDFETNGLSLGSPFDVKAGAVESIIGKSHSHKVISTANAIVDKGQLLHSNGDGRIALAGLGIGRQPTADYLQLVDTLEFSSNAEIKTLADNLALRPLKDLYLEPGSGVVKLKSGASISSNIWISGKTGWGITDAGDADFRLVRADELAVEIFRVDERVVENNSLLVTPGRGILAEDWNVPAMGVGVPIKFKDSPTVAATPIFRSGDHIRVYSHSELNGGINWTKVDGTVSNYVDNGGNTQTWTFTPTRVNAGAVGNIIRANTAFVNFGVSGMGFIEMRVGDRTHGPTFDIAIWDGITPHAANSVKVRVRSGQLASMPGASADSQYGIWIGGGKKAEPGHIIMSNLKANIHNIPLEMTAGYASGVVAIKLNPKIPSIAVGSPIPIGLRTGGDGFWTGKISGLTGTDAKHNGKYGWRVGGHQGSGFPRVEWNGEELGFYSSSSNSPTIKFDNNGNSQFTGLMTITTTGEIQATHTHFNHSGITIGTAATLRDMRATNRLSYAYIHPTTHKITPVAYIEATAPSTTGHRTLRLEMASPYAATWLELRSHGGVWASAAGLHSLGPLHADGTLEVKEASTLRKALTVYGATDLRTTLRVRGALSANSTALIGGALTVNGTAVIAGNFTANRAAHIKGVLTADTDVKIGRNLTVHGTSVLTGVVTASGDLKVIKNAHFAQGLVVGSSTKTAASGQIIFTTPLASAWGRPFISARANGMTGLTTNGMSSADSYLEMHSFDGQGGGWIAGAGRNKIGLWFKGSAGVVSTITSKASRAPIVFAGQLNRNTTVGGTSNLAVFLTGGDASLLVKGNGALWSRGGATIGAFDDEDDNDLLRGYSLSKINPIKENWNMFIRRNVQRLEELNLVDGEFVNMNGMMELQTGAIWQINSRLTAIEELSIIDMIKILFARVLHLQR